LKKLLFIILCISFFGTIYAQPEWENFQMSNTIFHPFHFYKYITVDRLGNKWIATQNNGLIKYDGTNWELFYTENSPLTTNSINHVFFDSRDNMWISTQGGGLYKRQPNGTWQIYNTSVVGSGESPVNFPSNVVNWVTEEANTTIWVGTFQGLVMIEGHTNESFGIFRVFRSPNPLPSDDIRVVLVETAGNNRFKWIATSQGLVRFDIDSQYVQHWVIFNSDSENAMLPANGITGLHIDNQGHKWMNVYSHQSDNGVGVVRLSSSAREILKEDWTVFTTPQLPSNNTRSIGHENRGSGTHPFIWITTDAGIVRYDGTNWVVSNTTNTPNLPTNDIFGIAIENSLKWFGTNHNLVRFDGANWSDLNFLNSGIPANHIHAMTFSPQNPQIKWIGTANGLTRYDGQNWRVFNSANSGLPINDIRTLTFDNEGFLWIGTVQSTHIGGSIIKMNIANNAMQVYTSIDSPVPWSTITKISVGRQNRIWIGTQGGALLSLRQTNSGDIWERYNSAETELPSDNVFDVYIDENDFKWIATDAGIAVMDDINRFTRIYDMIQWGLPTNNVRRIKQDREGYIWAVTSGGVVKLVNGNWIRLNFPNISNPNVFDIGFDAQNIKWIATSQGLHRTNEIDWNLYNTTGSELPSMNMTFIEMEEVSNQGNISSNKWIGSSDLGVTVFRGGHQQFPNGATISVFQHPVISNSLKITAVVNNIRVDNVAFAINNISKEHIELAQNAWYTDHLVEQNQNVRISFTYWFSGRDSTVIRNVNVSMLQSSNNQISIGDGAFLDIINDLPNSQWFLTEIFEDETGYLYYQFNDIKDFLANNLFLKAEIGHKIQKRNLETKHWYDASEMQNTGQSWAFISEGVDYRIIKDSENISNLILNLTNFPNPFNPMTTISFDVYSASNLQIDIYNLRGQKVKNLVDQHFSVGTHRVVWNGRDELENDLASGVYFVRIISENETKNRKILLLK